MATRVITLTTALSASPTTPRAPVASWTYRSKTPGSRRCAHSSSGSSPTPSSFAARIGPSVASSSARACLTFSCERPDLPATSFMTACCSDARSFITSGSTLSLRWRIFSSPRSGTPLRERSRASLAAPERTSTVSRPDTPSAARRSAASLPSSRGPMSLRWLPLRFLPFRLLSSGSQCLATSKR